MCLIVFAWRPGHALPLVVAANRDEFLDRPTLPLAPWEEAPGVVAGRDLQAGGTWLGIGPAGRFAALTNIREPGQPPGRRSRGELPVGFLRGELAPLAYLEQVAGQLGDYAAFNLLVGDRERLCYLNAREARPRVLPAGVHGLSNAGLDTPWPKLRIARAMLIEALDDPSPERLFAGMCNDRRAADADLPATGVPLEWERQLSSIFIRGRDYGTRASTVLLRRADGGGEIVERSFGALGASLGEVRWPISSAARRTG